MNSRAVEGLLQPVADDRLVDALDLDVHLQGGDAVPRAGDLEVHVTEGILLAEDVGQDREPAVGLRHQAHRRAGDRGLDRHTGIHQRERRAAGRGHRGRPVRRHALADEADDVRELIVVGKHGHQRPLGQVAVADLAPAGPTHRLVLAGAVRRHVVVVEIALLGDRADRVDPLDVRGRAERRDRQRLRVTTREQPRAMGPRDQPDVDRDGPDIRDAAAVHPDPLVENELADGLLVDQPEQALADTGVAARRLEQALGVTTRAVAPGSSRRSAPSGSRCDWAGRWRTTAAMQRSLRHRAAPDGSG